MQRAQRIAARLVFGEQRIRAGSQSPVAGSRSPLNCTQRRYCRRAGRCAPSVRPNSLLVVPAGLIVVTVTGRTKPSSAA